MGVQALATDAGALGWELVGLRGVCLSVCVGRGMNFLENNLLNVKVRIKKFLMESQEKTDESFC